MKFFLSAFLTLCLTAASIYTSPFTLIPSDSPLMSKEFSQLGDAYRHRNLIWSAMRLSALNYRAAEDYCSRLGARLPTIDEWELLFIKDAPSNLVHFNGIFWSSTVAETYWDHFMKQTFHDYGKPYVSASDPRINQFVRCVKELSLEELDACIKEKDKEIEHLEKKILEAEEELSREANAADILMQRHKSVEKKIQKLKQLNKYTENPIRSKLDNRGNLHSKPLKSQSDNVRTYKWREPSNFSLFFDELGQYGW